LDTEIGRLLAAIPEPSFKVGGWNQSSQSQNEPSSSPQSSKKLERFNRLDRNNDNKISQSEAKGPILERFDKLNKNNDEFISLEEFIN
jgi:hypothetical protein